MYNDGGRALGRTTRMLLKAMLMYLEGNNVVVTAYNEAYAAELAYRVMDMMYASRITTDVIRRDRTILFKGYKMLFERHDFDSRILDGFDGEVIIIRDHHWRQF